MRRGMRFGRLCALALTAAIAVAYGCGGGSPKLEGLVNDVPIYVPSTYGWKGDGTVYGDGGPWHSRCWFLTTPDPTERVIAFYQAKLGATETVLGPNEEQGLSEGEAFFRWIPPGGTEDEDVEVTVRRDEFSICESIHMSKWNPSR